MSQTIWTPQGNRVVPVGPPRAYQTYRIVAPVRTHWRPATCAEVNCEAYLYGWRTTVDPATTLGAGQAHYIRKESGRSFTELAHPDGRVTFAFEAGQRCFAAADHRRRLERDEIFLRHPGDWRELGSPLRLRVQDWVDDFGENQERVADRIERG